MNDFTELATREENDSIATSIVNGMSDSQNAAWSSFDPKTVEEKKKFFNALSSNGTKLRTMEDKVITINDCVIMPVEVVSQSGEVNTVPRCIIMDNNRDEIYTATSWGAYKALQRMLALFGTLHSDEGIDVEVKCVKTKNGETINLKMV